MSKIQLDSLRLVIAALAIGFVDAQSLLQRLERIT